MRSRDQTSHSHTCTVSCASTLRMARPTSAARSGSLSRRAISARIQVSNASRNADPSGPDLVQLAVQRGQHPARHLRPDRPADQAAALLAHPLLISARSCSSLVASSLAELGHDEGQHVLVPPARHQRVQRPRHHRAGAAAAQDARHDARQQPPRPPVLDRRQQARQHLGQRVRGGLGRRRVGQEAAQDAGQVDPATAFGAASASVNTWLATKRPSARPSRAFCAGMMAVCGIGRPSGWRNSAVTANQSATPPTKPAFALACSNSVQ